MSRAGLWGQLLLISGLWGSSFPLMREVAQVMPPLALATIRGLVAALAVALFLGLRGALRHPPPGTWKHILVVGTINGWLPNVLTALALQRIQSAPASLIQSATPLIIGLLATLLLHDERPGRATGLGMALGFAGIALIIGPQALAAEASLAGALLMLGTATCYALGTVYMRLARPEGTNHLVLGQQVMAALIGGLLGLALNPPGAFAQEPRIWAILLLLGVFSSALPLSLYLLLLRRARATEAAMVGYLEPPFAIGIAALWLGEIPEPRILAGGAVTLAGVWLATRK